MHKMWEIVPLLATFFLSLTAQDHYAKFERLFLVGRVSKKFFVVPKSINEVQILHGLVWNVEKKILNDI